MDDLSDDTFYTSITQLPDDFPFQEMGRAYENTDLKMSEFAAEWGMSKNVFKAIRKDAPQLWTKDGPNLWHDDLEEADDVLAKQAADRAKAVRVDRKARRRVKRDEKRAAERWWRVESALQQAAKMFKAYDYKPPKPHIKLSQAPSDPAALLVNGQDWHVGKRPHEAQADWMQRYSQSIKNAFATGTEKALRSGRIEKLYLVTGGDLVHVDGAQGTTSGTPQDLLCSPAEAFAAAVELVVWCIDYARALGIEVHLMTVMGNHDRTLSSAAGVAAEQRFHAADDVVTYDLKERVYATYGKHLILATHGDMQKRQWKKLPSIMMAEARTMLAETTWQTVVSGHLHFQASDLMDDAGTLFAQGSSPSPTDAWHYQEGYVGSRKGIQMLLMEPESCATSLMHEPVG